VVAAACRNQAAVKRTKAVRPVRGRWATSWAASFGRRVVLPDQLRELIAGAGSELGEFGIAPICLPES